jgi:DNA-binding MarR family transcriptional regulator
MKSDEPAPPPLVLGRFLPYRLSVAAELVSGLFAESYERRFGLTIAEWRVMAILGEAAPRSTQDVIERSAMDRVKVSRAAIRLADKGLIDRRPHPRDARAHELRLTRRGRAVYEQIVPLAQRLQAELAALLSAEERAQLEAILDKLQAAAVAMRGAPGALPAPEAQAPAARAP